MSISPSFVHQDSLQQQARTDWGGGNGIAVFCCDVIPLTRCHILYLKVGTWEKIRILLAYCPPCCSTVFLPELTRPGLGCGGGVSSAYCAEGLQHPCQDCLIGSGSGHHIFHDNHGSIPNGICPHSCWRAHFKPDFLHWVRS